MNISYIDYSIGMESLDIFFAGCHNHCVDCCNPELMSFESGSDYTEWLPEIANYLENYKPLIKRVILVGGSPNHQSSEEMETFLQGLKKRCQDIDIYMFCGEDLEHVQPLFFEYCDYIKCGPYIPALACDNNIQYGIKLATSNQKIYKKGQDY